MKRVVYAFWLLMFLLPLAVLPFQTARAQDPELLECWEDQFSSWGGIAPADIPMNVDLISFCIEYYAAEDQVLVTWETGTEIDTSGFWIQRSELQDSGFERISEFVYSESDGMAGASYEYEEDTAERGKIYYYKLEEIDIYNQTVNLFGPVYFNYFGPTLTPTSTPTRTQTPTSTHTPTITLTPTITPSPTITPTPTSTSLNPTATRTRTPTVTRPPATRVSTQAVLAQAATSTPAATPQAAPTELEAAQEITTTATLEPLPPVVLLFPAPTTTLTPTAAPSEPPALTVDASSTRQLAVEMQATLSDRVKLIGGLILVVWLFLGGFLVLYFRKATE